MIANIFYSIFTLTITVLACFMREKLFGFLHPRLHQGIALNPLGGLQLLPDIFGLAKNRCAHIFFALSPDIKNYIHTYIYQRQKVELSKQLSGWKFMRP